MGISRNLLNRDLGNWRGKKFANEAGRLSAHAGAYDALCTSARCIMLNIIGEGQFHCYDACTVQALLSDRDSLHDKYMYLQISIFGWGKRFI